MELKKDVFTNKEDKWDFIIALIVIVIFSVFIYNIGFKSNEKEVVETATELEEFNIKPINQDSIKEKKDEYLYSNSKKYHTKTIKTEDAYESKKDSAVIISDITKKSLVVTKTVPEPIINNKAQEPIQTEPKITTPSNLSTEVKEPVIKIKEKVIEKVLVAEPRKEVKTIQKTNATTFNCVIVVGVFKEANNKTAIISKLTTLGYSHTEGTLKKGLNYVGVPVACNNKQEKLKLLNDLNQAFGIQSWVKKI